MPRRRHQLVAWTAGLTLLAICAAAVAALLGGREQVGPSHTATLKMPKYARTSQQLSWSYSEPGELFGDGSDASLRSALAKVRGVPVVIHAWASWCGACKAEWPAVQTAAQRYGGKVAFIGVDVNDFDGGAHGFLKRNPVPFRSLRDPDERIVAALGLARGVPGTVILSAQGAMVGRNIGAYPSRQELIYAVQRAAHS